MRQVDDIPGPQNLVEIVEILTNLGKRPTFCYFLWQPCMPLSNF